MAEVNQQPDGYLYGLKALLFDSRSLGLIDEEGLDWGGDEPETVKVWSAQKRAAPVKEIPSSPGTNEIAFDLIHLQPDNLVQVAGGTVSKNGKKWNAPSRVITLEGPVQIQSADGAVTDVVKASLIAYPRGKFNYQEVMKMHCVLTFLTPDDEETAPYSVDLAPDEEETEPVG